MLGVMLRVNARSVRLSFLSFRVTPQPRIARTWLDEMLHQYARRNVTPIYSLVLRLKNPTFGNYTVNISCRDQTSLLIYKKNELPVTFGFSTKVPRKMIEASKRPMPGRVNYILVDASQGKLQLEGIEIQVANEEKKSLEIQETLTKGIYLANTFIDPEKSFRIWIKGSDTTTFQEINTSSENIFPQKGTATDPTWTKPHSTLLETDPVTVDFGTNATFACKVTGYPKPNIVWEDSDGNILPSENELLEIPSLYISYVSLENATVNTTIYCKAKNSKGEDSQSINVYVHRPYTFEVIQTPEDQTIEYGSEGKLYCEVSAYPPAEVKWSYNNSAILPFDDVQIDPETNALWIKNMTTKNVGEYECEVTNEANKRTFTATVSISGIGRVNYILVDSSQGKLKLEGIEIQVANEEKKSLEIQETVTNGIYLANTFIEPDKSFRIWIKGSDTTTFQEINTSSENIFPQKATATDPTWTKPHSILLETDPVTVDFGTNATFACKVTGYPKPNIVWEDSDGNILPSENELLEIPSLYISYVSLENATVNTTIYCKAKNSKGEDSQSINVYVHRPYTFEVIQTPEDQTIEYGSEGKLYCEVSAYPPAEVKWSYNNSAILPFDDVQIDPETNALWIKNMTTKNVGEYKCDVTNEANKRTFTATVSISGIEAPEVVVDRENVTLRLGETSYLECRIIKGKPIPTITWQYLPYHGYDYWNVPEGTEVTDDGKLKIISAANAHFGKYKCAANNILGTSDSVILVQIQYPPSILDPETTTLTVKEEDDVVLPCKVKASPEATVHWEIPHEVILDSRHYTDQHHNHRFRALWKDSGKYECIAENDVGVARKTITVDVLVAPYIEGPSHKTVVARNGDNLVLNCNVQYGNPVPSTKWQFIAPDSTIKVLSRNRPSRPLHLNNVKYTNEGSYLCIADNSIGTTNVLYGSERIIKCEIHSSVPIQIHWYYKNEKSGKMNKIVASEKYSISENGTELRIMKMDFDMVGRYICVASHSKKVGIILKPPKITGTNEIRVIRGTNAVIECRVIDGLPRPKITWEYKNKFENNFKPIPGSENELSLLSVTDQNGGSYKCVATNVAGEDDHITHLVIDFPPTISQSQDIYETFEGKSLTLPCTAVGNPKAVIVWKINGTAISSSEKYSIEDGALLIKNLNENDSTSYTCEAKNYVGSANAAFIVRVYTAPKTSGLAEVKVIRGSNAVIECNIIKGTPAPDITWLYWDNVEYKNLEKSFGSKRLLLPNVEEKKAGRYKCVAANVAGTDEHITTLIVESPPTIVSESSIEYEGVEGDIAFRIPCDVIGNPRPLITWKLNGRLVNPEFISRSERSKYVYILWGKTTKLDCEGYNSSSQSVRWFIESEEVPTKNPYIEIVKPTLSNDGNYTCRISDAHGYARTHTYVVDVGYPPKVPDNFQIDDWRGDVGDILAHCESDAKPEAQVQWEFNGKVLTNEDLT
ncbi:hypothetical protein B5X24_HaOG212898 [Helicoverpa armigera]|nr:hypothetical protein B5X24_HaOG212898 [Helicoverpa armigera]